MADTNTRMTMTLPRPDPTVAALADYLFDAGPAAVVLYEPTEPFRVLFANRAYQDLWPEPLRSRGLVGLGLAEYVPGAEETGIAEVFRSVARTGVASSIHEFAYDGLPGGTRWFDWTLSPVLRNGQVVALAHMAVDVSREVRAAREAAAAVAESRHAAELLELGDPFCELDREFRVIRVNAAHERINGHARERILGRTHWEIWPESALPSSPYWREYHRCMEERVRVEFDAHYAPLDVWTSVSAYPTAHGGIAIFWRDATERKRAEAALRDSEEKLRASFAGAAIGFALTAPDGRFLDANPAYCAITGYTLDELRSLTFADLVDPEDLADNLAHQERMAAAKVPSFVIESRYRRKDGSPVWVRKSISVVRSAAGEPLWNIGLVEDITDRKRAQEALERSTERLTEVVSSIQDDFYVLDHDWKFTFASRRFTSRVGKEPADFVGNCIWTMFPAHVGTPYEENLRAAMDRKETRRFEVAGKYTGAWFQVTVFPSRDGITVLGVEITESKRMQAELRAVNARLVEADRRKTEFLAVLSHELRNPLAPIRNSAYLLERAPADSDQARRAREVIRRQADHLTRLVDDLLDLTRITHGKIELQTARLDARDVASQACEDARADFETRGVVLRYTDHAEPLWVDADRARLAQMIGNLLANALKFTPAGGSVDVLARRAGTACQVEVRDSGAGIAPGDLERIFEPFVQAEVPRPHQGGLGIGLAIVKDLVARHGGSIRALSDGPGTGARFVLTLPLASAPRRASDPAASVPAIRPLSILIVEDNVDAATSLADILGIDGHEVTVVHTAREGIEALPHRFDVLLCDIGLPDRSGHEVIRTVRADPAGDGVFAIALTGFAQPEDRAAALEAGFDAHLPKPPPLDELQALLAGVARRRAGTAGLRS